MNSGEQEAVSPLSYRPAGGGYDEMSQPDGTVRPHWEYLMHSLNAMGAGALVDRHQKATRILRDDGATYNIDSDPSFSQTWQLDPVPLLIGSEEWNQVETGLRERAELLNLLLSDIYGPREVLKYGIIPPELLFSHSGYLRPCYDVKLPGEHQLINYAADLVRDSDGEFCVIADRSQAPSGDGYALENRTVISRILPSLFRDSQVHRLSLFFRNLRRKLGELSPSGDLPRVVVLTPGPYSKNYFEQVYLANYLGYPLVQGADLTVRNGYLWMKSLDGLSRVDVLLRRVEDAMCDPVELRGDSVLGVPGMLEIARAGRVSIVNPLGSGVMENASFSKYLPAIGKHFLGREPRLRSAQCWWCGDKDDLAYVEQNLDSLVIKHTSHRPGVHSLFPSELDAEQRAALLTAIRRRPHRYVAQQVVGHSHTPTVVDGELQPRPTVLRAYAVATESSYAIMPGALTRVGNVGSALAVSGEQGAVSKDTWILASEPEKQVSLRPASEEQRRSEDEHDTDIPSRVVENLFWFSRYAERAEFAIRLLRTVFMQLNATEQLPANAYPVLLRAITHITYTYPGFTADAPKLLANPEPELLSVMLDAERSGSVTANLLAMLRAGEEVKELLSNDTQRIINDIRDELSNLNRALRIGLASAPEEALDPLITELLALSGLAQESMVRGPGWHFLEMGRRLERAQLTGALIRALLVPVLPESDQNALLQPVLVSLEAVITYRRRFQARLNVANGLELLMLDKSNPRSLLYQLDKLREHSDRLPTNQQLRILPKESRLLLEASTQLQLSDLDKLAAVDAKNQHRPELDQLLSRLKHLLLETATAITDRYFAHVEGPQPIVRAVWEEEL